MAPTEWNANDVKEFIENKFLSGWDDISKKDLDSIKDKIRIELNNKIRLEIEDKLFQMNEKHIQKAIIGLTYGDVKNTQSAVLKYEDIENINDIVQGAIKAIVSDDIEGIKKQFTQEGAEIMKKKYSEGIFLKLSEKNKKDIAF